MRFVDIECCRRYAKVTDVVNDCPRFGRALVGYDNKFRCGHCNARVFLCVEFVVVLIGHNTVASRLKELVDAFVHLFADLVKCRFFAPLNVA